MESRPTPGLPDERDSSPPTIAYPLRGNCYLNVTSRCTLRCRFCPKFNHVWVVGGANLYLRHEPTVAEVIASVGDPLAYEEVVFCGLGEPTLRLYDVVEIAAELHQRRARRVRLNTDGLASLVYGRDVTPDLEGPIDAVSISLNAQNEAIYNQHCRPSLAGSYGAMLEFADRVRDFVPDVTLTAIDGLEGVDIAACERIAHDLGVKFRRRVLGAVG
ncbi:MAG TPA: TatD family nuclease-associated radical SAM protein [Burkholderiales bacterium]|nr:TatD family nuclease-associated radical SAM protein [Burkholderiales bacterium]